MKKGLCIILAALMGISLFACGAPAASEASDTIVFNDPVLEAMVRKAMYRTEDEMITYAEAEMVTELNLGIEWQQHIPEETQIKDISGLEHFTNLTSLDLSFHAISDISPLAGLTKLTSLSLGGNPVADLTPLNNLTDLTWLTLFNCQAEDYSPLSNLINLDGIMLDYSTIRDISVLSGLTKLQRISLTNTQVSDISPLAGLIQLTSLKLEACPITDFSPLADIYPNLGEKDFTAVFALSELGFAMNNDGTLAEYITEGLCVTVNHSEWGVPAADAEGNSVRMSKQMDGGYTLIVLYYPDIQTYVFQISSENGGLLANYIYDQSSGEFTAGVEDRESMETLMKTVLGDSGSGDVLLAPVSFFNDTIESTFGIDADELYTLPLEITAPKNPTLLNLGFIPDKDNAVCVYEQNAERYTRIEVYYPEWGEREYDVSFFTPINEYGLVVTYYRDEQRFYVAADKGDTYAKFNFYVGDNTWIDDGASGDMSVEEYFKNMYNDPSMEEVHLYTVSIVQQYIADTFGMSIDELCALPLGADG